MSIHNHSLTYQEKQLIEAGIKAGLADSAAGRGEELTDDYVINMQKELELIIAK